MQCDLCKQESSADGSLLCATCADAIRRLLAIQQDVLEGALSDTKQSPTHRSTWGAEVRNT
jgi:hypothetical protein